MGIGPVLDLEDVVGGKVCGLAGRMEPREAEGRDWTVSVYSTVVRAHQHAAGACHALPAELVKGGTTE